MNGTKTIIYISKCLNAFHTLHTLFCLIKMIPQIISTSPSIENCDPFKKYQKSTPSQYSLQEIPILYGGGRKWILNCSNENYIKSIIPEYNESVELLVDVFVLNTSFIIWFNEFGKGLEISYLNIPAHAVRKDLKKKLNLYIQLSFNDKLIEFNLRPKYLENERFFNNEIEKLFTYEFFGLNKGEKMIFNTFNSISYCSCLHKSDSDDDDEQLDDDLNEDIDIYENGINNSGNADDIDITDINEINLNSASIVDINDKIKNSRNRDHDLQQQHITDESNKRIRC